MVLEAYVENGVAMAHDAGSAAWVFDLEHWGVCGQGRHEAEALEDLHHILGNVGEMQLHVAERITGDENAFWRDRIPAVEVERRRTLEILGDVRAELNRLVASYDDRDLDREQPQKASFARWSTLRERAWHIADTESRYYMPSLGLASKPRADELLAELRESAEHVRAQVESMSLDAVRDGHETWTAVKLLRRLAWHERGEVAAMRSLLPPDRGQDM